MSSINTSAANFTATSVALVNPISLVANVNNNGRNRPGALATGRSINRNVDPSSTGIRFDNQTLSTFPITETANAISLLLDRAVWNESTVSPLTNQSTSPNPNVPTLMSPAPEAAVVTFARVYA